MGPQPLLHALRCITAFCFCDQVSAPLECLSLHPERRRWDVVLMVAEPGPFPVMLTCRRVQQRSFSACDAFLCRARASLLQRCAAAYVMTATAREMFQLLLALRLPTAVVAVYCHSRD